MSNNTYVDVLTKVAEDSALVKQILDLPPRQVYQRLRTQHIGVAKLEGTSYIEATVYPTQLQRVVPSDAEYMYKENFWRPATQDDERWQSYEICDISELFTMGLELALEVAKRQNSHLVSICYGPDTIIARSQDFTPKPLLARMAVFERVHANTQAVLGVYDKDALVVYSTFFRMHTAKNAYH